MTALFSLDPAAFALRSVQIDEKRDRAYTAWQLGADWWWHDTYLAVIIGGHVGYDTVNIGPHEGVRLERIVDKDAHPHVCSRYVHPDTRMRLVRIEGESDAH